MRQVPYIWTKISDTACYLQLRPTRFLPGVCVLRGHDGVRTARVSILIFIFVVARHSKSLKEHKKTKSNKQCQYSTIRFTFKIVRSNFDFRTGTKPRRSDNRKSKLVQRYMSWVIEYVLSIQQDERGISFFKLVSDWISRGTWRRDWPIPDSGREWSGQATQRILLFEVTPTRMIPESVSIRHRTQTSISVVSMSCGSGFVPSVISGHDSFSTVMKDQGTRGAQTRSIT